MAATVACKLLWPSRFFYSSRPVLYVRICVHMCF